MGDTGPVVSAEMPPLPEHVIVAAGDRDDHEQRWGMTYCRRCGRPVVNDRYPDKVTTRPCEVVKVSLR